MNTSSKSTNIYLSISQQSILLILTAFVNSPAGQITLEKIGLRYITIANTTWPPYNAYNKLSTPLPPLERYIIFGQPLTLTLTLTLTDTGGAVLLMLGYRSLYITWQQQLATTVLQNSMRIEFVHTHLHTTWDYIVTVLLFSNYNCRIHLSWNSMWCGRRRTTTTTNCYE